MVRTMEGRKLSCYSVVTVEVFTESDEVEDVVSGYSCRWLTQRVVQPTYEPEQVSPHLWPIWPISTGDILMTLLGGRWVGSIAVVRVYFEQTPSRHQRVHYHGCVDPHLGVGVSNERLFSD